MTETSQDDVGALREFLRGRDLPCPLCRYNLRDLTQPECPECHHELALTVGITRPRFLWFLLAISPCMFCAIAAIAGFVPIIIVGVSGGGAAPAPVLSLEILALASAIGGFVLIGKRFAFLRAKPGRQRWYAAGVWGIHLLALMAWFITMLILEGGP